MAKGGAAGAGARAAGKKNGNPFRKRKRECRVWIQRESGDSLRGKGLPEKQRLRILSTLRFERALRRRHIFMHHSIVDAGFQGNFCEKNAKFGEGDALGRGAQIVPDRGAQLVQTAVFRREAQLPGGAVMVQGVAEVVARPVRNMDQ